MLFPAAAARRSRSILKFFKPNSSCSISDIKYPPPSPNPEITGTAMAALASLAVASQSCRFSTHHPTFITSGITSSSSSSRIRSIVSTARSISGTIHLENTPIPVEPSDTDGGAGNLNGGRPGGGGGGDGGGGGGGNTGGGDGSTGGSNRGLLLGLWDAFVSGWRARVRTDPQFPFKVLTEEFIGVGACVLGDMATRPNFGLDELDFVFSTVVVGSILNFTLMYMLAPTSAGATVSRLPHVFASCPPGYMFEAGGYTVFDRLGTFAYKGLLFAGVGFLAGILGTVVSNALLDARKKVDPSFKMENEQPPVLLNAATWAVHMGVSSNLRYQTLNGLEYFLAGRMNPAVFKASVFGLRATNNVLGGMSFVLLARLTGSQRTGKKDDNGDS